MKGRDPNIVPFVQHAKTQLPRTIAAWFAVRGAAPKHLRQYGRGSTCNSTERQVLGADNRVHFFCRFRRRANPTPSRIQRDACTDRWWRIAFRNMSVRLFDLLPARRQPTVPSTLGPRRFKRRAVYAVALWS